LSPAAAVRLKTLRLRGFPFQERLELSKGKEATGSSVGETLRLLPSKAGTSSRARTKAQSFVLNDETPRGREPRGDLLKEVLKPMRSIRIEWGKLKLELPGNMVVSVVFKLASWLYHIVDS
jgi:hypothetical protein